MNEQADLFKGLTEDEAGAVLALGSCLTLCSGAELFRLGGPAEHLYLVQRGRIKLTLPMQVRGREQQVMVEERGSGQTVGWSALIPPYRFTLDAVALVDSQVIKLSREALKGYFADEPAIGQAISLNVASVVGQRLQLFQAMWVREMQRMVELRHA